MKQSTGIKAAVALVAVLVIGVVGAFKFLEKSIMVMWVFVTP